MEKKKKILKIELNKNQELLLFRKKISLRKPAMKCYFNKRKNELLLHITTRMNLKSIMVSENRFKKLMYYSIYMKF